MGKRLMMLIAAATVTLAACEGPDKNPQKEQRLTAEPGQSDGRRA